MTSFALMASWCYGYRPWPTVPTSTTAALMCAVLQAPRSDVKSDAACNCVEHECPSSTLVVRSTYLMVQKSSTQLCFCQLEVCTEIRVVLRDAQEMSSGQLRQFVCFRAKTTPTHIFRSVPPVFTAWCAETRKSNRFKHHTKAATLSW